MFSPAGSCAARSPVPWHLLPGRREARPWTEIVESVCCADGTDGEMGGRGGGDNERAILTRADVTAAGLMKGTDQRIRCDLGVESTISICLGILPFKRGVFWVGGGGGGGG